VHVVPFQHVPDPHWQTSTEWLEAGAQPHAPIAQVFGNALVLMQHVSIATVPPEATHDAARELASTEPGPSSDVSGEEESVGPGPSRALGPSPEESGSEASAPPAVQVAPFQHPAAQLHTWTE
jgi:hypothetical protein